MEKELKLRLLLRSVYLKGHQDGNLKTTDMLWEDKIIKDINKLMCERKELEEAVNTAEIAKEELRKAREELEEAKQERLTFTQQVAEEQNKYEQEIRELQSQLKSTCRKPTIDELEKWLGDIEIPIEENTLMVVETSNPVVVILKKKVTVIIAQAILKSLNQEEEGVNDVKN